MTDNYLPWNIILENKPFAAFSWLTLWMLTSCFGVFSVYVPLQFSWRKQPTNQKRSAAWNYKISVKGPSDFIVVSFDTWISLCHQIFRSTYWVAGQFDACQLERQTWYAVTPPYSAACHGSQMWSPSLTIRTTLIPVSLVVASFLYCFST